jgi:ribonuclease D
MPPASIVNNAETFQEMLAHLKTQPDIAIDTESNSLYVYQERVCLIQISTAEKDYLIDTLVMPGLDGLAPLFADPKIQKVFHAGDYDLATLKRDYGFEFVNLFDTMLAATALAEPSIGLAALLEKYLGVVMEKKYQRADWGKRPLSSEMLLYAQSDSHYLLDLRDILIKKLKDANRLDSVLEDSAAVARITLPMKEIEENIWKVRGAQDLNPMSLSLLKQLNHFREDLARQRDVPPFKVFSDRVMTEIASTQPHFQEELGLLPSLSPRFIKRYGSQIMKVIQEWRKNPIPVKARKNNRPSDRELKLRDKLSNWRKAIGAKEKVPSNVVLPRDLLELIAHHDPATKEELEIVMRDYPYRFQRYGHQIFNVIKRRSQ